MDPSAVEIDNDKALGWLAKGAQPTDTVRKLLVISGAWEQFESSRPPKTASERRVRPGRAKAPATKAPATKAPAKKTAASKAAATKAVAGDSQAEAES